MERALIKINKYFSSERILLSAPPGQERLFSLREFSGGPFSFFCSVYSETTPEELGEALEECGPSIAGVRFHYTGKASPLAWGEEFYFFYEDLEKRGLFLLALLKPKDLEKLSSRFQKLKIVCPTTAF